MNKFRIVLAIIGIIVMSVNLIISLIMDKQDKTNAVLGWACATMLSINQLFFVLGWEN